MTIYRYDYDAPLDDAEFVIEQFRGRGAVFISVEWYDKTPQELAEIVDELNIELRSRHHAPIYAEAIKRPRNPA